MSKPHYRRTASGKTMLLSDGLQNIVSGMGTERDKASHTTYAPTRLSITEIENAYQSSKFVQKIVDMPAEDAGREWREWQAGPDEISKIEATEKRLNVRGALIEALKIARLRGGSAILIGTGDKQLGTPLVPERVKTDGLQYLAVVAKDQLEPGEPIKDPRSEWFGQPEVFELKTDQEDLKIHPSRLVAFRGVTVPGKEVAGTDWWGDSILNAILTHVARDEGAAANVDSLMFEAKVDVVKIKDFMANLRSGGSEFEKLVLDRLSLAMRAKGMNSTLILDADEEYQQKNASFASLADLMDRFAARVAAVAEIPLTLMYGQSPGGLNATGDADTRGYYDRVKVRQTLDLEPNMTILDECIIASALGNRPEEIHYNWRPLWQVSEKEIAENADKITSAAEKLERIGVPMEAVARSTVNALTEIGAFPGLEAEFSTAFEAESDGDAGDVDPGTGEVIADAAPRTLYVMRPVLNGAEIIKWAKEQGFKTTLPADDLHVTIAFSREAVDWMKVGESWGDQIRVPEGGARLMEQFGEARVLLFSSSELSWRHEEIRRAGASWDHAEYQPHITISYDEAAPDLAEVEPYRGEIILGPETFQEVKENSAIG